MTFTVELLDAEGNVADTWITTAAENLEGLILEAAESCAAYDDLRFDGPGEVIAGSIRWRKEP